MTRSDKYILEEVDEVDVTTHIKALTAQMQENAKKLWHLEDENRIVLEENSTLKEKVNALVQQNSPLTGLQKTTPAPETGSSHRCVLDSSMENPSRNMVEAQRLSFEES